MQKQINDLWRTIPKRADKNSDKDNARFPAEPQENILYFLENTHRCWNPGSVKSCASYARSRNIFIPSAKPR